MTSLLLASKEHVEAAWSFAQHCLRGNPVLIIGSGASAGYGLPTMTSLGSYLVLCIEKDHPKFAGEEKWKEFKAELADGGLEKAIDATDIWKNEEIYSHIRACSWDYISQADRLVHQRVMSDPNALALSKLLKHLYTSDNALIKAITTNYDRLIEYAAEAADVLWRTNFHQGYLGAWRGDKPALEFWNTNKRVQENTLEIWKVHGSLDWFNFPDSGTRSIPCLDILPKGCTPVIVPPSLRKMSETHNEPFRKIIQEADKALREAHSFFCVGYGFNDDHIQVKLLERAKAERKAVVILVKALTDRTKSLFLSDTGPKEFLAFEESGQHGTTMYNRENPEGLIIEGQHVWDLSHFVNEVI